MGADNEDHDCAGHGHGAIEIPLGALFERARDRQDMAAEAAEMSMFALLDSLSVEHLMTMRRILNSDGTSCANNFVDGQIVSILRLVHRVSPITGQSLDIDKLEPKPAGGNG